MMTTPTTMLLLRASRSFFSPFSTVARRRSRRSFQSCSTTPLPATAANVFTSMFKRALYANRSEKDYLEHPNEESEMLFSKSSERSNGLVTVTKFGPHWRSLRFNDVEQGLAWVEKETERMDGKVLAYEYLRAMAAMTAAHRMLSSSASSSDREEEEGKKRDGMLMIGMGSGALPFFMRTHFDSAFEMETVEHDPVVIEAIEQTCFNSDAVSMRRGRRSRVFGNESSEWEFRRHKHGRVRRRRERSRTFDFEGVFPFVRREVERSSSFIFESKIDVHHELFQRRARLDREGVCSRHMRSIGEIYRTGDDDPGLRSAVQRDCRRVEKI